MENVATKEQQRQEAIARLRILEKEGLMPQIRKDFEAGKLYFSERQTIPGLGLNGILYSVHENPEFEKVIRTFESQTGGLAYHATHEAFEFGRILDIYYVSKDVDEWETDRADLEQGYSFVYSVNLDIEWCSEYGSVGIAVSPSGGLVRNA